MTKGKFYFLSDEYCDRFSKYGVMANKETASDVYIEGRVFMLSRISKTKTFIG